MPNNPDDFNFTGPNKPKGQDDFIDSSFAVQFKPGDKTESVADKLKETKENIDKGSKAAKSGFEYTSDNDSFLDEFDKFEYNSSITAFKPYKAPEEPVKPKAEEAKPVLSSSEPAFPRDGGTFDRPAPSPKAPEPPKESLPKFNDTDTDGKKPQMKPGNDKIFTSGNGLDYATSEHDKKTSTFLNAEKPEAPKPINIDIPGTQKPAAPAKAPAAQPTPSAGYRPYPSANKTDVFTTPTQAAQAAQAAEKTESEAPAKDAKPVQPVNPAANVIPEKREDLAKPASTPAPAAPTRPAASAKPAVTVKPVEQVKPAEQAKSNTAAVAATAATVTGAATAAANATTHKAPAAPVTPATPAKAPAAPSAPASTAPARTPANPTKPFETKRPAAQKSEPVKAPAEGEKPLQRPAASAVPKVNDAQKAAPAPVKPAAAPSPVKAAPAASAPAKPAPAQSQSKPAPGPAKNETSVEHAHRPGTVQTQTPPVMPSNSPFEPKSKQPVAATRGVSNANAASGSHHDNKTISPVTTVKKTKKKKDPKAHKDPGLAGLITFLAIIIVAIGILWALDNSSGIRKLFGGKTLETISTVTTEKATESAKEETDATTVTETTAKETTEATTKETTTATTTTEETTTEATTTTTEETTEETTEATTEASRTKPTSATAEGECVTAFSTNITNFSTTAGGFKFDIELTNKSRKTASLTKSLKYLDIRLFSDSTITDVSVDGGMTFTGDGENYRGIPEEVTIAAGETYTISVYVTTSSNVSLYGYNYAFFNWAK